jgi:hypothetical protein
MDTNNKLESRTDKYDEANDRPTFMSELERCMKRLEEKGYSDQFKVERKHLQSLTDNKKRYKPEDVSAVNFFRFEGISDPDDMSILYAIETSDGRKGTLVDAYGFYSDDETGEFMQSVDIHKKVSSRWEDDADANKPS